LGSGGLSRRALGIGLRPDRADDGEEDEDRASIEDAAKEWS
jgi:hypothetical protein